MSWETLYKVVYYLSWIGGIVLALIIVDLVIMLYRYGGAQ